MRHRRAEVLRRAASAESPEEVLDVAAAGLRALLPYDAAAWVVTDPASGLPGAPSLLDGYPGPLSMWIEMWLREFVETDVNGFVQLARAETPAASLRSAVGDPRRSARFRWFLQPLGFADELRLVLRAGGIPWALVTIWRCEGTPAFTPVEVEAVAGLSQPLGEALRLQVREGFCADVPAGTAPSGLLLFDHRARLISTNQHVGGLLEELPRQETVSTPHGLDLPLWLHLTVVRARDGMLADGDGVACTRVRALSGRWLVAHASTTRDAEGALAGVAVVLEPAGREQVAPIMVDAFGLTDREHEVAGLIARGIGTDDIAAALFLSPHTVRDHVKSILRKVGVSSRGELVATLYRLQADPAPPARSESGTSAEPGHVHSGT